jgi:hypothetical protein
MWSPAPSPAAALTLALVSALLLLTAATFKIIAFFQESAAAAGARETMGSDAAGPAVWTLLLPIAEIVIAFGILWFRKKAWLWALASVLFGSFAGYTFLLMVRGEATCGCFGDYGPPPWVMFTVDTILAVLCAMLASGAWGYANRRGTILTLAGVGALIGATYASASTDAPAGEFLDPVQQLMELPVMDQANSTDRDAPTFLVYVYQETCPRCQEHYPSMKQYVDATWNDPDMRGMLLEISDLEQMGLAAGVELPKYLWANIPTTLVVSGGRVLERFGASETPEPGAVFERYTSRDYETVLANRTQPASEEEMLPGMTTPEEDNITEQAIIVERLAQVPGEDGGERFAEIFNDAPGGTRHLLYAHTNCASCIEYRREMLELQEAQMLDGLKLHFAMIELLENDGVPVDFWGGPHAALLFDGGQLQRWYGDGEVSGDLPVDILFE